MLVKCLMYVIDCSNAAKFQEQRLGHSLYSYTLNPGPYGQSMGCVSWVFREYAPCYNETVLKYIFQLTRAPQTISISVLSTKYLVGGWICLLMRKSLALATWRHGSSMQPQKERSMPVYGGNRAINGNWLAKIRSLPPKLVPRCVSQSQIPWHNNFSLLMFFLILLWFGTLLSSYRIFLLLKI